jgi:hypothetical protein
MLAQGQQDAVHVPATVLVIKSDPIITGEGDDAQRFGRE